MWQLGSAGFFYGSFPIPWGQDHGRSLGMQWPARRYTIYPIFTDWQLPLADDGFSPSCKKNHSPFWYWLEGALLYPEKNLAQKKRWISGETVFSCSCLTLCSQNTHTSVWGCPVFWGQPPLSVWSSALLWPFDCLLTPLYSLKTLACLLSPLSSLLQVLFSSLMTLL